ncbi:hypothetical protein GCM10011380_15970 [Sphingomonas metalli]|uniref:Uncharacterized protein n=1 Tax=Sphingomonas metalli TaxID=1779358 RepID=A0A916T0U7_9SPHN|nr:DUF6165 family protein [Sphingomonas metalli]GGB27154.1 hypothetical protein GCM10011380_15970 [Sphingomonas metalli]
MASIATPSVPVSWGELLDKLTILEIKRDRIARAEARANVAREYGLLRRIGGQALSREGVAPLVGALKQVNEALWEIEDAIREREAATDFGADFVALARQVYQQNDRRAALKRAINVQLESDLMEEKSYSGSETIRIAPPSLAASTEKRASEPGAQGRS